MRLGFIHAFFLGMGGKSWGMEGGDSGHSTQDEGCGGLWRDLVEENGREMGRNTHFHSPIFPIFPEVEIVPTVSSVNISSPHSPTEKCELVPLTDTHRHGG